MGKIIVRVLGILLAASLVGGLIYLGVSRNAASLVGGAPGRGEHFDRPGAAAGGRGEFGGNLDRGDHGGEAVNLLAGLGGIARSLGIVAFITAGVLLLQNGIRFFSRRWKKRHARA